MNNWVIYFNLIIPFIVKIFIPDGRYGALTIVTDTIILPVSLVALNIAIFFSEIEASFLKCSLFMLTGLLLGNFVGYIIWGISSKNLLKPDAETAWITKSLIIYHACFVIILYAMVMGGKFLIQFFKKN